MSSHKINDEFIREMYYRVMHTIVGKNFAGIAWQANTLDFLVASTLFDLVNDNIEISRMYAQGEFHDNGIDLLPYVIALMASCGSRKMLKSSLGMFSVIDSIANDSQTSIGEKLKAFETMDNYLISTMAKLWSKKRRWPFDFGEDEPPKYADIAKPKPRIDQFTRIYYGKHIGRGLTTSQFRRNDKSAYNHLHVWCGRQDPKIKLSELFELIKNENTFDGEILQRYHIRR